MKKRLAVAAILAVVSTSVSAHVVRGLFYPTVATAFVSSPTGTADSPVPIAWGTQVTGLRVACFFVANTSTARADAPAWPRVTAVGFELPGNPRGFSLLSPLDQGWQLVEGVDVGIPGHGATTVDVALVAPVNPMGRPLNGAPDQLLGIPPGQPATRGSGTRFCLGGPFPDDPAIPTPPTPMTIERIINGVVLRFHGVEPHGPSLDLGVWENAAQRAIPLYP